MSLYNLTLDTIQVPHHGSNVAVSGHRGVLPVVSLHGHHLPWKTITVFNFFLNSQFTYIACDSVSTNPDSLTIVG